MLCSTVGMTKCRCGKNKGEELGCITRHSIIRKVFSDHSWYTLEYLTSVVYKLPTATVIRSRLFQNQEDIGTELKNNFSQIGEQNGKDIGDLFKDHISNTEACVIAIMSGNKKKMDEAKKNLFEQGDYLIEQLTIILDVEEKETYKLQEEFHTHNQHVINLAVMLINGITDKKFIIENDAYQNHMMRVADMVYIAAKSLELESQTFE